ncbi:MAG: zinc-binding alcohol dehydrogenase [Crocinitomicaceae bacterium]
MLDQNNNQSIVLHGNGKVQLEMRETLAPDSNEVLVETIFSAISPGTERNLLLGTDQDDSVWSELQSYPRLTGYSNVGKVVKVGSKVDSQLIGEIVHNHGAHQQYAISAAEKVTVIPEMVNWKEATFASLGKVTMNSLRRGAVTWGETVLVTGMGIVGQFAVQFALIAGAKRVVAVDISDERLALLPKDDRIITIKDAQGNFPDQLQDKGIAVDVGIEASGNPAVINNLAKSIREQGRLVMLSSPNGTTSFHFHDYCNRNSLTIIGSHGFSHPPHGYLGNQWSSKNHGELFMEYMKLGLLDPSKLITHEFSSQDAISAYKLLSSNKNSSLGIILNWSKE